MGGTVAVTVRMEDGTEYRMRRWTNALPWFYNNLKFFEKDPSHIEEYLSQWKEMKADWEANNKSGKFQFNMTECYTPYPAPLAPYSYGIVVFDFMKNVIVSCQGYTSFDKSYPEGDRNPEKCEAQSELFSAGRIKRIYRWDPDSGEQDLPNPLTIEEFKSKYLTRESFRLDTFFNYDTSPFTVYQFLDHAPGWRESKKVILDLGFKLTDEDEKAWEEHLKFYDDLEKENEDELA